MPRPLTLGLPLLAALAVGGLALAAAPPPSSEATPAPSSDRAPAQPPARKAQVRSFDTDAVDKAPAGFAFARTGSGATGRWLVRAEAGAPSGGNVLAQVDADDTDDRFPVAVLDEPVLKDVRVSVRCRMVEGKVDQACGLVARYRDQDNYLLTRANALEDNVRLYTVRAGHRRQIASFSGPVTAKVWHEYRFELKGDHLEVFWDGVRVLDHHDATFADAGRVGVWTKADSITWFDDLAVEALL